MTELTAENAALKRFPEQVVKFIGTLGTSEIGSDTKDKIELAAKRVKTTATDTAIAELRAQGVDLFAVDLGKVYQQLRPTSYQAKALKSVIYRAQVFISSLRAEASK